MNYHQHSRLYHGGAARRKNLRHSTPHRVLFSSLRELLGSVVNTVSYETQGAYRLQAFSQNWRYLRCQF